MAGPTVDLVLLRGMLPELPLAPGSLVTGRVADARTLILEGVRMQATLPAGAEPGHRYRMRVEQASSERLALKIISELPSAEAAARGEQAHGAQQAASAERALTAQAYPLALPGGTNATLYVERDGAGRAVADGGGRPVVIRYDSPSLGRLDIRLDRESAAIHVSAGEPADRVRAGAGELREALERVRGSGVQVTVHPRLGTFDARA